MICRIRDLSFADVLEGGVGDLGGQDDVEGIDVLGRTIAGMRMYSLPWLMPSRFSPRIAMLPLVRTCTTVTVTSPVSLLPCAASPSPSKSVLDSRPTSGWPMALFGYVWPA